MPSDDLTRLYKLLGLDPVQERLAMRREIDAIYSRSRASIRVYRELLERGGRPSLDKNKLGSFPRAKEVQDAT